MVFYGLLFTVPPLCMLLYTRGQVSLGREELLNTPVARERVSTAHAPPSLTTSDRRRRPTTARRPTTTTRRRRRRGGVRLQPEREERRILGRHAALAQRAAQRRGVRTELAAPRRALPAQAREERLEAGRGEVRRAWLG